MRLTVLFFALMLIGITCVFAADDSSIKQNINSVENGLVVMSMPSLPEQFQLNHIGTTDKKTLSERMGNRDKKSGNRKDLF
jgi:hypothetical protein